MAVVDIFLKQRDSQENIETCLSCKAHYCTGYCEKMKERGPNRINRELALKLLDQGVDARQIAERLGVKYKSFQKWMRRNRI